MRLIIVTFFKFGEIYRADLEKSAEKSKIATDFEFWQFLRVRGSTQTLNIFVHMFAISGLHFISPWNLFMGSSLYTMLPLSFTASFFIVYSFVYHFSQSRRIYIYLLCSCVCSVEASRRSISGGRVGDGQSTAHYPVHHLLRHPSRVLMCTQTRKGCTTDNDFCSPPFMAPTTFASGLHRSSYCSLRRFATSTALDSSAGF